MLQNLSQSWRKYLLYIYVYITLMIEQYRLTESKEKATKFMYLEAVEVAEQMYQQIGYHYYIERA